MLLHCSYRFLAPMSYGFESPKSRWPSDPEEPLWQRSHGTKIAKWQTQLALQCVD